MQTLLRHWHRIGVTLIPVVLALIYALGIVNLEVVNRIDDWLYDLRLQATMPSTLDERIVILDLDEKSLTEVGRWPWGRDKLAQLVNLLFDQHQIAILGFDVVFAEPDHSSGLHHLQRMASQEFAQLPQFSEQLQTLEAQLNFDARFANALHKRPVVLGFYLNSGTEQHTSGQLPAPAIDVSLLQNHKPNVTTWSGYGANIPQLATSAPVAGFFNPIVDNDGVVRSLPMLAEYQGQYYESLSLAMFRMLSGMPRIEPGYAQLGTGQQRLNTVLNHLHLVQGDEALSIPVDRHATALIPYRGAGGPRGGSFRYVSASDVLAGRVPSDVLKNKIVLFGTTAPGLMDMRVTPVSNVYPGVEAHANMLSGLLDNHLPLRPEFAIGYEVLMVLLAGLSLALVLPLLTATRAVIFSAIVIGTLIGLNGWLFYSYSMVLPLASQLLMGVVAFALNMSYGYFVESRSKRELAQLFGTYVPPELVQEMLKEPEKYSMKASNSELTVMFCDMRGFTQMSENMEPIQLQALLNAVFSRVTAVIRNHRGTIDKYMGDCVMAFWGAPVAMPQHCNLVIRAAMEITKTIEAVNKEHLSKGLPQIGIGIGINTGLMCVGDMGSNIRRSYTVIGDAVNVGSRLESLSKMYSVDIVVSEYTRALATEYTWQELDRVRLKGKAEAIRIFTPLSALKAAKMQEELSQWHAFLIFYREQQWHQAWDLVQRLLQQQPDCVLYRLYYDRMEQIRRLPHDTAWDGVTQLETK